MTKKYVISEMDKQNLYWVMNCANDPREELGKWLEDLESKKPIEIADIEDAIRDAIDDNAEIAWDSKDQEVLFDDDFDKTIKDAIQNIKDKGIELGG